MKCKDLFLNEEAKCAWKEFLGNQINLGHVIREFSGTDIEEHVETCLYSAKATVGQIKAHLPDLTPKQILEIGSSVGLNCFALQQAFPEAEISGIEPEQQAVNVAIAMRQATSSRQPNFSLGYGEQLPLPDSSVDLIVCHTVIEHVNDVDAVIKEMARVLSPTGVIHLDAPNYRFPYEPHLRIFTIPLLGKGFVKFCALLQGQWKHKNFINHLQFVTPATLQCQFKKYGLQWQNRAVEKLNAAASGTADIKKYRQIAKALKVMQRFGLTRIIISIIGALGFYPSVLYTLRKKTDA